MKKIFAISVIVISSFVFPSNANAGLCIDNWIETEMEIFDTEIDGVIACPPGSDGIPCINEVFLISEASSTANLILLAACCALAPL